MTSPDASAQPAPGQAQVRRGASLHRREVAIFFGAAFLLFTANLGGTTLAPLDDCFYARKAAEMAERPGLTVTWAGRPAFQNPPGQIWLMAASMRAFGSHDFAARLPAALMTLGVLAGTAWIGARLFTPAAGLAAAALLAISPLFLNNARRAMLETPSLFWVVWAMAAVVAWRRRPVAVWLFAPALAMAVLSKSVLGLVPLAVVLVAALEFREWRPLLRDPRFWAAAAFGLALGGSWSVHQWRHYGLEFVETHYLREIGGRSRESIGWLQRVVGYPAILLTQFQPVLPLAIAGIVDIARVRAAAGRGLVIVWATLPVLIAVCASAQSARYVYAILPALALLGGAWLAGRWPGGTRVFTTRVVPALMLAGAAILWIRPGLLTRDLHRAYRDAAPALAAPAARGAEVAFLGDDYWRVANPLLWYDGLRLAPASASAADAIARARAANRLIAVERGRWAEVEALAPGARLLLETRDVVMLDLGAGR